MVKVKSASWLFNADIRSVKLVNHLKEATEYGESRASSIMTFYELFLGVMSSAKMG